MPKYVNVDEILHKLPDDLPYKASVKRVLIQAPAADVVPKSEFENLKLEYAGFEAGAKQIIDSLRAELTKQKIEVEKIFEDVESIMRKHDERPKYQLMLDLTKLKKKYTEGEK